MLSSRDRELIAAVDLHRDLIVEMEKTLWGCPEVGFKEWKTTRILREAYEKLGYTVFAPEDIPGFYVDIDTGRPGPKILFCGELDALRIPAHPENVDGCVHACGHHAQCCGVLGVAAALTEPGVLDGLCGSIRLMAVPAEESDPTGFRKELIKQGTLRFETGKREFMRRGYMDGVDIGCMLHTNNREPFDFACDTRGSIGIMNKTIRFLGKSVAHGATSYLAVNSLSAATLAIQAINTLHETFRGEDCIMIGYNFPNTPATTLGETVLAVKIKGASMQAIEDANKKISRAAFAAATAIGATVEISDQMVGYAPMRSNDKLLSVMRSCMEDLVGKERVEFREVVNKGATDMGDVAHVIPCIHPFVCGGSASVHSTAFAIADPDRACVNAAKVQLMLADRLLSDNGRLAHEVMESFVPVANSFEEHLANVEKTASVMESELECSEDGDKYIASMRRV
ncbi:MAG: M20/M25/M40 family metallo-hydrolase [Ruminococcaceae bacterium]|nr:M20/M25/M40 family metallo-hydrolase [Oscillospiraceae bacterium]